MSRSHSVVVHSKCRLLWQPARDWPGNSRIERTGVSVTKNGPRFTWQLPSSGYHSSIQHGVDSDLLDYIAGHLTDSLLYKSIDSNAFILRYPL